jgi:hypothetical protein
VSGPVIVAGVRPALTVEQRLTRAESLNAELLAALVRLVSVLDKQLASAHTAERKSPLGQARAAIAKAAGGAS